MTCGPDVFDHPEWDFGEVITGEEWRFVGFAVVRENGYLRPAPPGADDTGKVWAFVVHYRPAGFRCMVSYYVTDYDDVCGVHMDGSDLDRWKINLSKEIDSETRRSVACCVANSW